MFYNIPTPLLESRPFRSWFPNLRSIWAYDYHYENKLLGTESLFFSNRIKHLSIYCGRRKTEWEPLAKRLRQLKEKGAALENVELRGFCWPQNSWLDAEAEKMYAEVLLLVQKGNLKGFFREEPLPAQLNQVLNISTLQVLDINLPYDPFLVLLHEDPPAIPFTQLPHLTHLSLRANTFQDCAEFASRLRESRPKSLSFYSFYEVTVYSRSHLANLLAELRNCSLSALERLHLAVQLSDTIGPSNEDMIPDSAPPLGQLLLPILRMCTKLKRLDMMVPMEGEAGREEYLREQIEPSCPWLRPETSRLGFNHILYSSSDGR
jgi:hypothetical protein